MSPPKERAPSRQTGGAQNSQQTPTSLHRTTSDERAFCPCGSPILRRHGECYHQRHQVPLRVLVRPDGGRGRWVTLEELKAAGA
jgi:hypothetical protein